MDLALAPDEVWPQYADDEIAAVAAVLRSGGVNQWTGPHVTRFETAFNHTVGARYGLAVANGSLALELALRALEIGPGDEVIVTPRSFVASAHCVRMVGATPVFADVDLQSGNLSPEGIAEALTSRTRAIIPVHLAGWPADMPSIMELAKDRSLKVIEDCAQAVGASIAGRPVGSFGDAAAFSFCQDKIISTGGEGGYVTFCDEAPWQWARSFKDHGKNLSDPDDPKARAAGEFRFMVDRIGTNWRMTGLQAAIGLAQLEKLVSWSKQRRRNARIWIDALSGVDGIRAALPEPPVRHACYKVMCYVDLPGPAASTARHDILEQAHRTGLRVLSGGCSEIYRERAYCGPDTRRLPNARRLGETTLMMEVHPTLDPTSLKHRAEALAGIAHQALANLADRPGQ